MLWGLNSWDDDDIAVVLCNGWTKNSIQLLVMTSFDVGQLADSNLFWGVEFSNNKEHGNFNEAFEDDKHKERIQLGLYLWMKLLWMARP